MMAALAIGGIALAIGAGYWISRSGSSSNVAASVNNSVDEH